jgi:hypothetical protein
MDTKLTFTDLLFWGTFATFIAVIGNYVLTMTNSIGSAI